MGVIRNKETEREKEKSHRKFRGYWDVEQNQ